MKLSLEIPTAYLSDWSPLCDLDFVLAHRVLEDDVYASFFSNRPKDREVIMDNSMHELGHPLSIGELEEAAKRCNADFVVAPDRLGQPEWNLERFKETHRVLGDRFRIAVSMCGRDSHERSSYLGAVRQADMLCLPYREPRVDWLHEHTTEIVRRWYRIHLFGVSELSELRQWDRPYWDGFSFSIDTAKPIKWGYAGRRMNALPSVRGASLSSADLLGLNGLKCSQTEAILWNIAYLRKHLP